MAGVNSGALAVSPNLAHSGGVNAKLVIDPILGALAGLVARLATQGNARTLVADLPDRFFFHLATALESQGLSKKIVADMCGLALRSYQKRMQRLAESRTDAGRTLWEAVFTFLNERGVVTRSEIERRFARDDPQTLGSVLHDLVESGLVFRAGSGATAIHRAASEGELSLFEDRREGAEALVWLTIHRHGPIAFEALLQRHRALDEATLEALIEGLLADGRITNDPGERSYRSRQMVMRPGDRSGAAAAIVDHLEAVFMTLGQALSLSPEDPRRTWTGGSTYTFELTPGDALEDEVRGLLGRLRAELTALRERADSAGPSATDATHAKGAMRVVIYCGLTAVPNELVTPNPGESNDESD